MNAVALQERLIEDLVLLRRAERASPGSGDIAAVRADLEAMAGPTITRAAAARLLGVSQTALERWIASGDVPVLITPSGHLQTPLHALVELIEAVRKHRTSFPTDRHPLGAILRARRIQAERLNTSELLSAADRVAGHPDHPAGHPNDTAGPQDGTPKNGDHASHRAAEQRGLAYHRAVAARLDEQILRDARTRLARWRSQERIDPSYADAWKEILALPTAQIAQTIGADTPRMRDLRQSSPFAGALTELERRRVQAAASHTAAGQTAA